jgi:DNA anti-recombination protein RmuC
MIPPNEQGTLASERPPADEPASVAKVDATGGAHLDKVRDILFGSQLREIDRRLARLEERLIKETNDLKSDVKNRLDAFDSYMRHETESLTDQMQTERHDRGSGDEQLSKGLRELRQQLLDQHQHLSDDIRRKVDEVLAALARETGELRSDKADRATLASLLTEMAMRLTNELTLPDTEAAANG